MWANKMTKEKKTLKELNLTEAALSTVWLVAQTKGAVVGAGVALACAEQGNQATGLMRITKSTSTRLEISCSATNKVVASWCVQRPMTKRAAERIEKFEINRRQEIIDNYPELILEISALATKTNPLEE